MRTTTIVALLSVVALGVDASLNNEHIPHPNHKRAALSTRAMSGGKMKRCTVKGDNKPQKPAENVKDEKPAKDDSGKKDGSKAPAKTPSKEPTKEPSTGNSGLMRVTSSQCGASKAVSTPSKTSGPNGDIHWLTCGVTGGGWKPPKVTLADIHTVYLTSAINTGPFTACKKYLSIFNSAASKNGLPAILLASIAMQESSCNANTIGGNGEQGLMQLTKDKCPNKQAGAKCLDPEYNINRGAQYFKETLDSNGGNVLLTMGAYNGWTEGMTTGDVANMKKKYGCQAQQNLDYLQQLFNGFLQGKDPYAMNMGAFFNLKC